MRFWLFFFLFSWNMLFASLYKPFRQLQVYETEHFEWIFPTDSAQNAIRLANQSELQYKEISDLLKFNGNLKIPVVLTPDSELLNGYFTSLPFNRIALYEVSPDLNSSLGNVFGLEDVFFHELTHAISLNIRSSFFDFLSSIFGDALAPELWVMPMWMIEGVTVSFESLNGRGRVNDPLVRAVLIQDASEGRFFSLDRLSGAYDAYRDADYYGYGGFFNHYLQKKYGMERYAELWRRSGGGNFFVGLPAVFRDVYGLPLREEWKLFQESFKRDVKKNDQIVLSESSRINLLRAGKKGLYYLNRTEGGIFFLDPNAPKPRLVLEHPGILSFDVNQDETRLLLTLRIARKGGIGVFSREYDLLNHKWVDSPFPAIREAVYGEKGEWIGIRLRGEQTDLVRVSHGRVEVIFRGHSKIRVGNPVHREGHWLALLQTEEGIFIGEWIKGKWRVWKSLDGSDPSIRDLYAHERTLCYVRNSASGLFRIGVRREGKTRIGKVFSGGAASPVYFKGSVYYIGHFRDGTQILRYPEEAGWEGGSSMKREFLDLPSENIVYPTDRLKDYNAWKYLNPFATWFPYPVLGQNRWFGLGFFSYLQDPAENFLLQSLLSYDWNYSFLNFDETLNISFLPVVDLNLRVRDSLIYTDQSAYRYSDGRLSFDWVRDAGWENWPISLSLSLNFSSFFFPSANVSPYDWIISNRVLALSINGSFGHLYRGGSYERLRGVRLFFDTAYDFFSGHYKGEVLLEGSPRSFSFRWKLLCGMADEALFYPNGRMRIFGSSYFDFPAYYSLALLTDSYVGGELSQLLFNFEIQHQLWIFPIYWRRIFGVIGFRTFYVDGFYKSFFADLSQSLSFPFGAAGSFLRTDLTLEGGVSVDPDQVVAGFLNLMLYSRY